MMSLLSSQLAALFPRYDFTSAGSWLQDGAANPSYRILVASLALELTASTATSAKIKVHLEVPKGRSTDNTVTTAAKEASPEFVREFYFRCLNILVTGGGGKHVLYPFLIQDTFGFNNMGELLDALCATGCATLAFETLELRRELVRFLAAEVTSLRLAYRRTLLAEEEANKKKAKSQEDKNTEEKSAGVTAEGNGEKGKAGGFTHEDARFVLCLLQELSPTDTRVADVIKTSEELINKLRAHTQHNNNKKGDAKSISSSSAVAPLFPPASAVKPEHLQAVEMLHKVLGDSYALRWATQLERMQCTLKAFLDIETELFDAPISAEEAAAIGKRKGKGGASPSCALSTAEFLEMKGMLEHASGILSRFFDHPCLAIEGDLFPSSASSSSTMCVGMVNTAFAPISIFHKKTNFSRRNAPLVPVPDRGGRTNVSNFDRAVSSSAKQKDSMMRQGSGGGGGGGSRGRGGGRGGGNGNGARHADPNKSADQVRSGGGNWSGRGGGGRGKGGNS